MNRRLVLFVVGLIILSAVVLSAVAVWLPEHGITQVGPSLSVGSGSALSRQPLAVPGLLISPSSRVPRAGFLLRPFGLHRAGWPGILWYLGSFVSVLVLAAMALYISPRRIGVLVRVISNGWDQRLLAFVIGLLGYLGFALLTFLIFVNVVGWPLLAVLIVMTYLATGIGLVAVSLVLGAAACQAFRLSDRGALFQLGVGVVLLFLGSIIPYIGWVVAGVSAALGFGAVLWTRCGDLDGWSLAALNE